MRDTAADLGLMIQRAREDQTAVGELLEHYRPFLSLVAEREVGVELAVRCDASDIVQQTLMEASQTFGRFRGASEPEMSSWPQRILAGNLTDAIRKHRYADKRAISKEKRLFAPEGSASFVWREPAANQSTPSQRMIRGENALRLARLLQSLPADQRQAVQLRHMDGLPGKEIAAKMDRTVAATAGLIKRGLTALRLQMSEESWR